MTSPVGPTMRPILALALTLVSGLTAPMATQAQSTARIVHPDGARATHAVVGETVELRVQVRRSGRWRAPPEGSRVRWLRVRPHMQHVDTPPPNEGIAQYSNSVLFGPRHGRWLGYDTIEYETVPLEGARIELAGDRARIAGTPDRADGAGTMWVAAAVTLPDGTVARTPDADDTDRLGLRPTVARLSFRTGDDFLGWLSTYFGVPNVFGSTGPQADRYLGADCADVLVGALRASGNRHVRYASVGGIGRHARAVTPSLTLHADGSITDDDGQPVELLWGEDVEPGDLLAIDYVRSGERLPRAWDHIGALVGDGSPEHPADGRFDAHDRLRHMVPSGLVDWPLGQGAPIRFRIWRWSDS